MKRTTSTLPVTLDAIIGIRSVRTALLLLGSVLLTGCSSNSASSSILTSLWKNEDAIMAEQERYRTCIIHAGDTSAVNQQALALMVNTAFESDSNELKIEALRAYSAGVSHQYKRSQSIQLYRDASFALCQAYQSGMLSEPKQFSQSVAKLLTLLTHNATLTQLDDDQHTLTPESERTFMQLQNELALTRDELDSLIAESTTHDAYLMAQLAITTMAFQSLEKEYPHFYNAEVKQTDSQMSSYQGIISDLKSDIHQLKQASVLE